MPIAALRTLNDLDLPIPGADPWRVEPGASALSVMTDFRERASVTVGEASHIDAALEHMKHAGVRCAFVIGEQQRVVGLITAYDILGEAPMRHVQAVAGRREDVLVRDIMRKMADWQVLEVTATAQLTVDGLYRLFESSRLTHIPVIDTVGDSQRNLRGLFSAAKVRRLLGR